MKYLSFMYHSGTFPSKQTGMGLNGPFVSHCVNESAEPRNDKDYFIMLSSFEIQTRVPMEKRCPQLYPEETGWHLFNGHSAPSVEVLTVNAGERVKIRFGNAQDEREHPIHLHGHKFWQTSMDGGGIPGVLREDKAHTSSTVVLSSGKTYDILFDALPGIWRMHCHIPDHMVNRAGYLRKEVLAQPSDGNMLTYLCVRGQTGAGYINCTSYDSE